MTETQISKSAPESLRAFLLALMMVGAALVVLAVYQYANTSYRIGQNLAFQIQSRNEEVTLETQAEAQALMAADISLRELQREQNMALIYGGGGLILLAAGWIARDVITTRAKRAVQSGKVQRSK